MARAHFVKSARKDNPVAKKGESYYWWKFMQGGRGGPKRYSRTAPRRSDLTQSDFYKQLYEAEDAIGDLDATAYHSVDDLKSDIEEIKSHLEELESETQEKHDNMPEGLQQGDAGQLLEERVSELQSLISELDGLDYDEPQGSKKKMKAAVEERCQEIIEEAQGFNWSIS